MCLAYLKNPSLIRESKQVGDDIREVMGQGGQVKPSSVGHGGL